MSDRLHLLYFLTKLASVFRDVSRRLQTPQQDREVQCPQGDQGCWIQEAVPEVLGARQWQFDLLQWRINN